MGSCWSALGSRTLWLWIGESSLSFPLASLPEQIGEGEMLWYPCQGGTSPRSDLTISPLKTKVYRIQTVNNRDISAAGISSVILSLHLVTVFSSCLCFLITQRRRCSPFTGQKRRVWQAVWNTLWVLLDQLSRMGVSQAWDKQAAWILQSGWKSSTNVPTSVPLGNRQAFLLPWVHTRADACSFEATVKALIDVSGVRLSPPGYGSSGTEHGQIFDNFFNH